MTGQREEQGLSLLGLMITIELGVAYRYAPKFYYYFFFLNFIKFNIIPQIDWKSTPLPKY